jgi:hypothetical protein
MPREKLSRNILVNVALTAKLFDDLPPGFGLGLLLFGRRVLALGGIP